MARGVYASSAAILRRACAYLVLSCCAAVLMYSALGCSLGVMDDAYITLTYAKNLALGKGFIYNAGPPSLGTTSPAQAFVMAGIARLFSVEFLPVAARVASVIWLYAAALLLHAFRHRFHLDRLQSLCIGILWLGAPNYFPGNEACMFLFTLVCALLAWSSRRDLLFGALCGTLMLVRGEGILLGGLWCVDRVLDWRFRRATAGAIVRGGVWAASGLFTVLLPWGMYAWSRFGMILPNTMTAKIAQGRLPGATTFGSHIPYEAALWGISQLGALHWVLWLFAVHGLVLSLWRKSMLRWYLASVGVFMAAYTLLAPVYAEWYSAQPYFAWLCLIGVSLGAFASKLRSLRHVHGAMALRAALIVIVALLSCRFHAVQGRFIVDPRAQAYQDIAEWMRKHARPEETLVTEEIGYLGFYCDNPIIDLQGLVDPELLELVIAGRREEIFRRRRSDYYIDVLARADLVPTVQTHGGQVFHWLHTYQSSSGFPIVFAFYRNQGVTPPGRP